MSNPYTPSTPDQPGTPHVPGGQATPAGPPHPQSGPTFPQGAPAPLGTPTPQAGPPSSGGKGPRNIPALVALVLAVLGTILALVHGVMILGWVLLPAAFILSIVGLVQHGRPKGMAIAALILSILGTVAGVMAFAGAVGDAVDEAVNTPVTGSAQSGAGTSAPAPTPVDGEDGSASGDGGGAATGDAGGEQQGSRANPYPLGTEIVGKDWTVTVNSFTADATDQVLAANQFNEAPAEGSVYALANVTVTYTGDSSGYALETTTDFVTAGGNVVGSTDSFAVAPDPLGADELYPGASVTGNVVLEIPSGDAGLLRVRPGILSDEAFVALS